MTQIRDHAGEIAIIDAQERAGVAALPEDREHTQEVVARMDLKEHAQRQLVGQAEDIADLLVCEALGDEQDRVGPVRTGFEMKGGGRTKGLLAQATS